MRVGVCTPLALGSNGWFIGGSTQQLSPTLGGNPYRHTGLGSSGIGPNGETALEFTVPLWWNGNCWTGLTDVWNNQPDGSLHPIWVDYPAIKWMLVGGNLYWNGNFFSGGVQLAHMAVSSDVKPNFGFRFGDSARPANQSNIQYPQFFCPETDGSYDPILGPWPPPTHPVPEQGTNPKIPEYTFYQGGNPVGQQINPGFSHFDGNALLAIIWGFGAFTNKFQSGWIINTYELFTLKPAGYQLYLFLLGLHDPTYIPY